MASCLPAPSAAAGRVAPCGPRHPAEPRGLVVTFTAPAWPAAGAPAAVLTFNSTLSQTHIKSSALIGLVVFNNRNEKLININDLMMGLANGRVINVAWSMSGIYVQPPSRFHDAQDADCSSGTDCSWSAVMSGPNSSPAALQITTQTDMPAWVTRIIRRHIHDLRNTLYALEMNVLLVEDLAGSPEAREAVVRTRDNLGEVYAIVNLLSVKFDAAESVTVAAGDLLQLWKYKVTPFENPSQSIEWQISEESCSLTVNTNAVLAVLTELTLAAWKRASGRPLRAALQVAPDGAVSLQLLEPANHQPMPEDLLEGSGRFIAANGGRLEHRQDPATGEWLTKLTFGERQS